MENRKDSNTGEGGRAGRNREENLNDSVFEENDDQNLIPLPYSNTDEAKEEAKEVAKADVEGTTNDLEPANENKERNEKKPERQDTLDDLKDNGDDGIPEDDRPAYPVGGHL